MLSNQTEKTETKSFKKYWNLSSSCKKIWINVKNFTKQFIYGILYTKDSKRKCAFYVQLPLNHFENISDSPLELSKSSNF